LNSSEIDSAMWIAARAAVNASGVPAASAAAKSLGRFAVLPPRNATATRDVMPAPKRPAVPGRRAATAEATRIAGRKSGGVRAVPRRNMSLAPPSGEAPTFHAADSAAPMIGTGR
jgi:hypothetical protein